MTEFPTKQQFAAIGRGYHPDAARSFSLSATAYIDPMWYRVDIKEIISRTWQWVGHVEKLREPGSFVTVEIAGQPIAIVRDLEGTLRIATVMADDAFKLAKDPGAAKRDALARHASARFGLPEDIANMVAWLASNEATFVTGQCFTSDGGLTAASPLRPGLF